MTFIIEYQDSLGDWYQSDDHRFSSEYDSFDQAMSDLTSRINIGHYPNYKYRICKCEQVYSVVKEVIT